MLFAQFPNLVKSGNMLIEIVLSEDPQYIVPNPSDTLHILAPGARLRPLFRSSASGTDNLKFDEEMGPEMKPSEKALRASKALAELNKGDDKLTRKSEEQVNKVGNKVLFVNKSSVGLKSLSGTKQRG